MEDSRSILQLQDLRQVLQEKLTEFGLLQTEWSRRENELRSKVDQFSSQHRDLVSQNLALEAEKKSLHIKEVNEKVKSHQEAMTELQVELDECLMSTEATNEFEDLDAEIEELEMQLKNMEAAVDDDNFDVQEYSDGNDDGSEERINKLEAQLDELQRVYADTLAEMEEDSKNSTQMLTDLIIKHEKIEESHQQSLAVASDELNKLDKEREEQITQIQKELNDEKKQIAFNLKESVKKMMEIEEQLSKSQKEHNGIMDKLQEEAETLRFKLESLTSHQKQQMKDRTAAAKRYAEEKRKFVSKHKEFQILNSELVRERIEHQNLMKELSRMDDEVLTQINVAPAQRSSSTTSKSHYGTKSISSFRI